MNANFADGGMGIPVISLLIAGGYNSLVSLMSSAEQGIPILVCEGTGRAANLLSKIYRKFKGLR